MPSQPEPRRAARPLWTDSEEYWATHDFGRHGRPRPGTRLIITAGPQCGHSGARGGTVLPYDGRWHDTSFPVDLHNGIALNFGTRPARNRADNDVPGEYELVGTELEDGFDLCGMQTDGNGGTENVTLRAKIRYPRASS
ncbi:hypothetical protein ACSHWB_26220 [Lentzea sp. HUAS TT2]|uniref:hypothetical protein n=1 Tax=Lentzea sp. HUAS TT2 TaxID=3447454 RepID=UPI003F6F2395